MFALCCWTCAIRLWRTDPAAPSPPFEPDAAAAPSRGAKACWLLLSACTSLLFLAFTNKMCQDIAVVPFLWVLPLSLYLLSFIVAFSDLRWYNRSAFAAAAVLSASLVCYALFKGVDLPITVQIPLYAVALFIFCLICHAELYDMRPASQHLTLFYLVIAGGGAIGGCFVALIAPLLFNTFFELHLGLLIIALVTGILWARKCPMPAFRRGYPLFIVALGFTLGIEIWLDVKDTRLRRRNFYGALRILDHDTGGAGVVRILFSGDVTHGLQFVESPYSRSATSYYHAASGVGRAWQALAARSSLRVGMVGLGVGTLAAYAQPGDQLRFYEINPAIKRLASEHFSFLSNCPAHIQIVLGDARLSMESEAPQNFDLLVLDAFTGDAIPVHLLTREAFETYKKHLRPDGIIAVHITNRYLKLHPVVNALARTFGYHLAYYSYEKDEQNWSAYSTTWALLTRDRTFFAAEPLRSPATNQPAAQLLWTDDYASLFRVLK
jgi:protein-L-isoaspartate O-methyltransferase